VLLPAPGGPETMMMRLVMPANLAAKFPKIAA